MAAAAQLLRAAQSLAAHDRSDAFAERLALAFEDDALGEVLPPKHARTARGLARDLSYIARTGRELACPPELFRGPVGGIVLAWVRSVSHDHTLTVAGLLQRAEQAHQPAARLVGAARARLLRGPVVDALIAARFSGDPRWILDEPAPRARLELLVWEAAQAALVLPAFGDWILRHEALVRDLLERGSRGDLRTRIFAAQLLSVLADPSEELTAEDDRRLTAISRDLARHPEPLIWIPAARAMGRLSVRAPGPRALLFRWIESDNVGERRRAHTALGTVPPDNGVWLDARLEALVQGREEAWTLAALGPALPFIACQRRSLFSRVARLLEREDTPVEALWSAVQGLLGLHRRGDMDRTADALLRYIRTRALRAKSRSQTDAKLWHEIRRSTDDLDEMDPDPSDPELLIHRSVTAGLRTDMSRVASRLVTITKSIPAIFEQAMQRQQSDAPDQIASGLASLESCVRAASLGMWRPALRSVGESSDDLDLALTEFREEMLNRSAAMLRGEKSDFARHRTAMRCMGTLADASPSDRVTPERLLRALSQPAWLVTLKRRDQSRFQKSIADVLWRIVDAARTENDPRYAKQLYSRFAGWWIFAGPDPRLLEVLARSEPAARGASAKQLLKTVERVRARLTPKEDGALDGSWIAWVRPVLEELALEDSALARAIEEIALGLAQTQRAHDLSNPGVAIAAIQDLADACGRLTPLIRSPKLALSPMAPILSETRFAELATEAAEHLTGDSDTPLTDERLAMWKDGVGPVLGPIVFAATGRLLSMRRPTSWTTRRVERQIGPYTLSKRLGGGGQGEVWLARNERNARRVVVKLLPRTSVAGDPSRLEELKLALQMEADILKRIYHPNVAHFIDNGWQEDQPYLVMEYLIGADLESYSRAKALDIVDFAPIVLDISNGLTALHHAGLVHCDLKPGNIFLRIDLPSGEAPARGSSVEAAGHVHFDPDVHRDDAAFPILGAVVIDFGVSRGLAGKAQKLSGTVGYIAPEQIDGVVHPNTDTYAFAATIYRSMTGHFFFEHLDGVAPRLIAHGGIPPFDDPQHMRWGEALPPDLIQLLKDATALDPEVRPSVRSFGQTFLKMLSKTA